MHFLKWLQFIDLLIRIFKLLDNKGKKVVADTFETFKDEESKQTVAKTIADTINKAG